MEKVSVDVIIPAYKPDASLKRLIRLLCMQTCPVGRIVIINTEEKYWDESLAAGASKVEVFHIAKDGFDHAGTRNRGAGYSIADYLLFMTQDAVPADRHLVESLLRSFDNPQVKAAYARQLPGKGCSLTEACVRSFNYPGTGRVRTLKDLDRNGIKTYFCSNVCAMYEGETFREMGGFTAPAIFNEDMVYAARLMQRGYGVAYAARARVYHSHNYTALQQFRRNFDNGVSHAMYPEIFAGIPSAAEGKRLVRFVSRRLVRMGRWELLPGFYWECLARLAGFRLGRASRRLPRQVVMRLSSNAAFIERNL